jgi:hypothetical protein
MIIECLKSEKSLKMSKAKMPYLANTNLPDIYACQLRAIEVSTKRYELVDIYKASHRVFGYTLPLFQIVTAIRERLGHFQVEEI